MKKIWKSHYGPILSILLLCLFAFYIAIDSQKIREYHKTYHYMDTYINVKLYTKSPRKARTAFRDMAKIYEKYDILTSYKESETLKNLYYIKNNKEKTADIKIEAELYQMLSFGKEMYTKSGELLDIGSGSLQEAVKKKTKKEALTEISSDIDKIHLRENDGMKNTKPYLYLEMVQKGFANKEVEAYLDNLGISMYLINAGGHIITGEHYGNASYKVGLEDPTEKGTYYKMVSAKKEAVVTKTIKDDILNPKTHEKPSYHKAVTVIGPNAEEAEALSHILFMQSLEDGEKYLENRKENAKTSIKVIWYSRTNQVTEKTYKV